MHKEKITIDTLTTVCDQLVEMQFNSFYITKFRQSISMKRSNFLMSDAFLRNIHFKCFVHFNV